MITINQLINAFDDGQRQTTTTTPISVNLHQSRGQLCWLKVGN